MTACAKKKTNENSAGATHTNCVNSLGQSHDKIPEAASLSARGVEKGKGRGREREREENPPASSVAAMLINDRCGTQLDERRRTSLYGHTGERGEGGGKLLRLLTRIYLLL